MNEPFKLPEPHFFCKCPAYLIILLRELKNMMHRSLYCNICFLKTFVTLKNNATLKIRRHNTKNKCNFITWAPSKTTKLIKILLWFKRPIKFLEKKSCNKYRMLLFKKRERESSLIKEEYTNAEAFKLWGQIKIYHVHEYMFSRGRRWPTQLRERI